MDLLPIGCLPLAHCSRRRQGKEPSPAKADLTSPMLEWNKAWSLKSIRPQCRSRHTQGAAVAFWIRVGWLYISKVTVRDCMNNIMCGWVHKRNCQTDIIWDWRRSGYGPTGPPSKYVGKRSSGRGRAGFVQSEDFESLSSLPLPGPCYLIHNPSLNCEHRCSSHPQPARRIVYPISWWSVQLQVNHNIHLTERLGPDGEASITTSTLVVQAIPLLHST